VTINNCRVYYNSLEDLGATVVLNGCGALVAIAPQSPAESHFGHICALDEDCVTQGGGVDSQCISGLCYVAKGRFLSINPVGFANVASGTSSAFRVSLVPAVAGGSPSTLGWISLTQMGNDGTQFDPPPHLIAGVPDYADWSNLDGGGKTHMVHVSGCEIAPGWIYWIQSISQGLNINIESNYSIPVVLRTAGVWADVIGPPISVGPTISSGPNGNADFEDILGMVNAFEGSPTAPLLWFDVEVNNRADFGDILRGVGAFEGAAYPYPNPMDCP
jgi:hypothetical protein